MQGDLVGKVGTVHTLMEYLEALGETGRDARSGPEASGCFQREMTPQVRASGQ